MGDLITVIVPIYDVEQYLNTCIESITQQAYENLEILLIDDGSPDNCPHMCDQWAKKDNRIKVIHKKNGGLSSARNAGLDVCTGDYISFVDSDDYLHKDMYSILMHDIKEKNVDVVKCAKYYDVEGEVERDCILNTPKEYTKEEILHNYFYYQEDFCGGCWDKLYKAELFRNIRFPEGINSEDYYMYVQLYTKINKLYFNNVPLYFYRIRENSICRKPEINEHSFDKIIVSDMVYEYIENNISQYIEDAKAFQAISRFAIYNRLISDYGYQNFKKEWQKDIKRFLHTVLRNKKINMIFKFKYLMFALFPKIYCKVKRIN